MERMFRLETTTVSVRRTISRKHFRASLAALVVLPAPVALVIEASTREHKLKARAGSDRVSINGQIAAVLYYRDHDHLWRREEELLQFQHLLDLPGVRPENLVRVTSAATVPVFTVEEEGHAVRLEFALDFLVEVEEWERVEMPVAVTGAGETGLARTPVTVANMIGEKTAREIVENVVELPEEAVQIFRVTALPQGYTAVAGKGKVDLGGSIALQILYLNGDHALRSHAFKVPSALTLTVPEAAPGQRARVEMKIVPLKWQPAETPGKSMTLKMILEARVALSTLLSLEPLTGVSGSGPGIRKRALSLEHVRGEMEVREDLKFMTRLPEPAAKLIQADLELEKLTGRAFENEIAVTGTFVQKLYCLKEEESLLYQREEIPFAVTAPMPGCHPGFDVSLAAYPVPAAAALIAADRVEQEVALGLAVQVTENVQLHIVTGVTILEPPSVPAALYLVQAGDTVPLIARRFRVTREELLAVNPQLQDPSRITAGEKVYIPRS